MRIFSAVDAEAAAVKAAALVEAAADRAIRERGKFNFALSGGHSPWRMMELLSEGRLDWGRTSLFQVDERIAPSGSPQRNLTHLVLSLPLRCQAAIRPMPVGAHDLETAMGNYEYSLPDQFDLVHLGLGGDGHTASLFPGEPTLETRDRRVATTESEHDGTRRMTFTYPTIESAREIMFLVLGGSKAGVLRRLVAGDRSIPAGRIEHGNVSLVTDLEVEAPAV